MAGRLRQSSVNQRWSKGRLRVQDGQSGQVVRYKVRRGKGKKTGGCEKETPGKSQALTGRTLVSLTNKTNWQQTNRRHRYKYTGDNGEDR